MLVVIIMLTLFYPFIHSLTPIAASVKKATEKAAEKAKQAHEVKTAAAAERKLDQVFGFDEDGPAQR